MRPITTQTMALPTIGSSLNSERDLASQGFSVLPVGINTTTQPHSIPASTLLLITKLLEAFPELADPLPNDWPECPFINEHVARSQLLKIEFKESDNRSVAG